MQRYSDIPLPRWRYVPGRGPHPRHRDGPHLPPLPEPGAGSTVFDVHEWPQSTAYRYAIDLFNHAYFWEAHEVLEDLLGLVGRDSAIGRFLSSLIQLSAAMLKEEPASHAGARRLMTRALRGLPRAPQVFLGIDVAALERDVQAVASGERAEPIRLLLQLEATDREQRTP